MINYHHLFLFWIVKNAGGIKPASVKLKLAQSTISAQLSSLEKNIGGKLFNRVGRHLEPTDLGHMVFGYADKIFTIGQEMMNSIHRLPEKIPLTFRVGVIDVVPKLLTRKFLLPAMEADENIHLVCQEGKEENLLPQLAAHNLDVILTDTPVREGQSFKAYNHLLFECGVSFFGAETFPKKIKEKFPYSLDKAPMLVPMNNCALRGRLDQWFEKLGIHPRFVGEFDDSALLKVFGQAGDGIFASPQVIEKEIMEQYNVKLIGKTDDVIEKFYAVSVERVIKHPAIAAITEEIKNNGLKWRSS